MELQNFSYALFELALLLAVWLVIYSLGAISTLLTKRFLLVATGLYVLWAGWDRLAIRLGVFRFPEPGNLPIRLLGVPLEEHLFFLVHTLTMWALVLVVQSASAGRRG